MNAGLSPWLTLFAGMATDPRVIGTYLGAASYNVDLQVRKNRCADPHARQTPLAVNTVDFFICQAWSVTTPAAAQELELDATAHLTATERKTLIRLLQKVYL